MAAETTLDFDAPHISKWEGLAWWFGGFGFFFGVYTFATVTDAIVPSFQNKAVRSEERQAALALLRAATAAAALFYRSHSHRRPRTLCQAARGPTRPFGGLYTELGSHGKKSSMSPDTEEEHEDEDEDEDDE